MSEEIINGYQLLAPLSNANAGFAKWGFARKNGTDYFIKEFLDPVYPTAQSPYDEAKKVKMIGSCRRYQKKMLRMYQAINHVSDGNLVRIEEFFRWGSHYYITTKRIIPAKIGIDELHNRPMPDRLQVCLVLTHALMQMHSAQIVHADLKPDNILLQETIQGSVTAKIIDIDGSFFEWQPTEELTGDQVYFAPEAILYMCEGPDAAKLSCKMDVFSMGLILHQVLTGSLPGLRPGYDYAFEACLDGKSLTLSNELPLALHDILSRMLRSDPEQRCHMSTAFSALRSFRLMNEEAAFVDFVMFDNEDMNLKARTPGSRISFGPGLNTESAYTNKTDERNGYHPAFHRPDAL